MPSSNKYSLAVALLLTAIACARQEEPEYDYGDEASMEDGGTSSGGSSSTKAGTTGSGKSGSSNSNKGGSGTALPPAGSTGGRGGTQGSSEGGASEEGGADSSSSGAGSTGAGSGGSGGSGDPVNMPVDGVSVHFKAQEGASADFIGGELFVKNDSNEAFALANLKIRYYFTNELNSPPAFTWQWGQFGPANNLGNVSCSGQAVEMPSPKSGANFYVELTCPDGTFDTGMELRTSWKAGNQGNGKLDQSDDWSYVADQEGDRIVILDGNTIIWGIEP